MAEEPSSTELAEADEAETPAPAEEPMETVTVSLTKKKGEIIQKTAVWLNRFVMKRRILIGSLRNLNLLAIPTAHELISATTSFNTSHKISSFYKVEIF